MSRSPAHAVRDMHAHRAMQRLASGGIAATTESDDERATVRVEGRPVFESVILNPDHVRSRWLDKEILHVR